MSFSILSRRASSIGVISALSLMLAACGQPQSVASLSGPAAAASPAAMVMPTMTAAPTVAPTATPTATAQASPAASQTSHDHMSMGSSPAPSPARPQVAATIKLFMFSPEPLEVKAGTMVVWTNQDDIEHSVTSGAAPAADGAFDSDFFTRGQTYAFTFEHAGEYRYFCKRHSSMTGTVKVTP